MANVVLIYPSTGLDIKGVSVWLPLSVLHVASNLVKDYDVVIVDQRIDGNWKSKLSAALGQETLCVGISSMTGTQIKGGLSAAQYVRELAPELPIVWGGNHPTLVPHSTVMHPLVDIVVLGEGEITFRRCVEALERGESLNEIPDLVFKKDGKFVQTGSGTDPSRFIDPSKGLILPYHLVDVERYISGPIIFGKKIRALPYISSQGCPHQCTFCCQPVLSKRKWRCQPAEMVVERALELKNRFNLDAIEFHDEEFFVNRNRGVEIAELIGGKFEWYVQTRMDDILALDLDRLAENGLRVVQPGIETGSPRMLEMIKKGETVEDFIEGNRRLAASGLNSTYNFMMGYPTETKEDLIATVELALKLLEENVHATISGFYVYVPYPGAELYQQAVIDGFEEPKHLEEWSAFNRQHLVTPWISSQKNELEMLLYTSKLIDGRRFKNTFSRSRTMEFILKAVSSFYKFRWRKHDFRKTLDIELIAFAAKKIFNW
ncbi:TPA: hypothetical protein DEF17_08735 [bacterium]|nr:hypothetical protein [bacterium]